MAFLLGLLFIAFSAHAQGPQYNIHYVKSDAAGNNSGTSWQNAFTNLQSALGAAEPGDDIWVAAGTYRPSQSDVGISFELGWAVSVYGGFAGNETAFGERNPSAHPTILSGDLGTHGRTTRLVIGTDHAMLDGFILEKAGIGLDNLFTYMWVENCIFRDNAVGALNTASTVEYTFTTFENNSQVGMSVDGLGGTAAPYVTNCIFRNHNVGSALGGGITGQHGDIWVVNSLFADNSAGQGGAMYFEQMGVVLIYSCTFTRNSANYHSGAVFISDARDVSIKNSIFWQNQAGFFAREFSIPNPYIAHTIVTGGFVEPYVRGTPQGGSHSNLFVDPLFVSSSDFRLQSGSPAIDAGENVDVNWYARNADGSPIDLAGNLRWAGDGPPIDIGAYEYHSGLTKTITSSAVGCGIVSPSGAVQVPEFTDHTVTFIPDLSCRVQSVVVDGVSNPTAVELGRHTFPNVSAPHTITVTFVSKNAIPFLETWESGRTDRWITDLSSGGGVISTGDNNKALCLQGTSSAEVNLAPGTATAYSVKFRNNGPTGSGIGSTITFHQGETPNSVTVSNDRLMFESQTVVAMLEWHEFRVEIDRPNDKIYYYIDNVTEPIGIYDLDADAPFDRITIENNNANVCWDDIYIGHEFSLTVNDPANGWIETLPGWVRSSTSGSSAKYVYRQPAAGQFPVARLVPHPDPGYTLQTWTGAAAASGSKSPGEVVMNADKTASATFMDAPFHAVERIWGGVSQPTLTVKEGIPFNTLQNLNSPNPPVASFSHWIVQKGPGFTGAISFTDGNQQAIIRGGSVRLVAQFHQPQVEVFVRDAAYNVESDKNVSKPEIRIMNTGKIALTDFYFEYYFHTECLAAPQIDPAFPGYGTAVPQSLNGGNYKVVFFHSGTLNPNDLITVEGGGLEYTCSGSELTCPKHWKRENDYSLMRKGSLASYQRTGKLPVFLTHPGTGYPSSLTPVSGSGLPALTFFDEPAPDPAIKSPVRYTIPSSIDDPIPTQYPNLQVIHAYPTGTLLANGSFEQNTMGWEPFYEPSFSPPWPAPMPTIEIGFHSPEFEAFDGFSFLRVRAFDGEYEGAYLTIKEGDPAFNTLMTQDGTGLDGKGVVLSAWVRGVYPGMNSVRFAHWSGSAVEYDEPLALDPVEGRWSFVSRHFPKVTPFVDASGIRSIRLAIVEGSMGGGDFLVDGAALTPGDAYSAPLITHKLFNTRYSPLQTLSILPDLASGIPSQDAEVLVTNVEYDALGRQKRTYLPYAEKCLAPGCNPYFRLDEFNLAKSQANQHYDSHQSDGLPDAEGFAFSETRFENDQAATIDATSKPGLRYSLESGHFGKRNYSGVSSLSLAALTTGGTLANPGNKYDPVYAYTHSVDEDGKETLEWKNGFGQVVQAAGVLNSQSPSQYAVTRNIYDARGNLVKVLPPIPCQEGSNPRTPQDCVDPTTFDYDDENRLIRENLPDAGTTRHFYDRLGQKRGSQNQRQWREKKIVVHVYDPLGRILQTSEVHDQDPSHGTPDAAVAFFREKIATDPSWPVEFQGSRLITKYFYDEMPDPVPYDMMSSVEDFRFYPAEEWHTFENTRTHLCAVVNFHEPIEAFDPTQRVEPISSIAYRYDKFGRITTTYRYNGFISDPGFKLQKTEVDYDLAGRTAETRHFRSAAQPLPERIAKFTYNSRNQLQEVTDGNGASIARYEYFPTNGKVKSVLLGEDDANPITAEYRYHISGALEQISASKKIGATQSPTFRQKLFYDLLPSGQPGLFNGSIAVQEYQLGTLPGRSTAYQYDRLNRLVNAAYSATSGSNSEYDEAYEYLLDGRIAKLQRGTAVGTPNGGRYHYGDGKNQVKWVEPGMEAGDPRDMSGSDAAPAFLYDENGNLNYDDSKIMLVDYDHRGLPLRFSYVKDGIEHQLETRYDHEGSRVSKIEFARGADEEMEFEESVKTEYLVDGDPNQPRDFSLLAEAYTSLRSQLAEVAEDPGVISIIEVLDPSTNEPDLQIFTGWEAIPYAGGLARTELRAVHRGSPEYYALLNRYSENLQLVKATHYTSFGNEIREDFQVEQGTKTIFNLPQGLGRYEEDGTRLYYLENHQGNTMLAATSSSEGFKAAYDYFPYGRQKVEQTLLADKITETFTGKELDDETGFGGLYYFGARYYDPDLGLWISPDPARQFHSPYAYSPNPIVSVDPDGKFAIIPLIVGYGTVMAADMPEVQADLQIAMMDPDPFGMAVGIAAAFVPGVPAGLAKEGVKGVKAGMIGSYNALRALNKNTGSKLEAHHIIEKRFADIMGQKPGEMLSILVDKTTHNKFTKAMADLIPRGEGTAKATKSEVLEKTKQMYQQVEGK